MTSPLLAGGSAQPFVSLIWGHCSGSGEGAELERLRTSRGVGVQSQSAQSRWPGQGGGRFSWRPIRFQVSWRSRWVSVILQRRVGDCLHSLELERWLDAISAMVRAALCRPWVRGQSLDGSSPKCAPWIFFCRASTTDHSHSRQHLRFSPCCPGTHYASPWFSLCGLFRLPGIPPLARLSEPWPWLQPAVGLLCRLPPTQLSRGRFTCGSTSAPCARDRHADPPCLPHAWCMCPLREARLLCAPVTVSPPRRAVLLSRVCVWGPLHTSARSLLIAGSSPSSFIIPKG